VYLQLAQFILAIAQMGYITFYIKRHYKWIDLHVTPNESAISQRKYVMMHQIASLVLYRTDVVVLSVICGLKVTSVYVIYNMLFEMISTLIQNITSGFSFKLGQTYNSNIDRYKRMYNIYETYNFALSFSLFLVGYLFMLPFVRLYTHGVTDINYLDPLLPLLFVTNKILISARTPAVNTSTYAGHFRQTQGFVIIQTIINIVISILCTLWLGIYGILIGTTISCIYYTNALILYTNHKLLLRSPWRTYRILLINSIIFIIMVLVSNYINISMGSYMKILKAGTIYMLLAACIFFAVNSLIEKDAMRNVIAYTQKRLRRNLKSV
ncbi:MAG: sugar isomerase, partial [Armatimonadota bacterium]